MTAAAITSNVTAVLAEAQRATTQNRGLMGRGVTATAMLTRIESETVRSDSMVKLEVSVVVQYLNG
jgi:hypothetical protein